MKGKTTQKVQPQPQNTQNNTQNLASTQQTPKAQVNTPNQQQTTTQTKNPTQANTIKQVDSSYLTKKDAKAISTYDRTTCVNALQGYSTLFDQEKIDQLSDTDLQQLLIATQSQSKIEKLITKNKEEARKWVKQKAQENDPNAWQTWKFDPRRINDIKDIRDTIDKNLSSALAWAQKNPNSAYAIKDYQFWADLDSDYKQIESQYTNNDQQLKQALSDNKTLIQEYKRTYNPNISSASNDNYSQEAKDDAIWYAPETEGNNYQSKANNYFMKYFVKAQSQWTPQETQAIKGYTNAFSRINNPLRDKKYTGVLGSATGKTFKQDVNLITSAIDKSTLTENCWIERGTNTVDFGGSIGVYNGNNGKLTPIQLQSLVGQCMEEQAFSSHTVAKSGTSNSYGTTGKLGGFTNKKVIFNTYCPVGTKGAYLEPISQNKQQYELLLQRGYSYKITKAYYTGNTLYIDREVILGSDINKYDDTTLDQLAKRNF